MKNWANWKWNGFNHAESTAITNQQIEEINQQYTWVKIIHDWFAYDDIKQKYVQYAYKLWWFDFVRMIECENWNRDLFAKWDGGDAFGLCQMNKRYHKNIPQDYYNWVWQVQIEYCYEKWKWWTKFYWPKRWVEWKRCNEYVKDRFTFVE